MGLSIMRVYELPFGRRVIRLGDRGRDVKELQTVLKQAGFFFGEPDGLFGTLTAEAVTMMQKAQGLRADGVVGPEFYRKLGRAPANTAPRPGRIVYSVKKHESLTALSQRFGVRESAWESLSGQGNPQKRFYPGMKLFLPEKLFYLWEDDTCPRAGPPENQLLPVTGLIHPGWRLLAGGEPESLPQADKAVALKTIAAEQTVWEELFQTRRSWNGLALRIRTFWDPGVVFDLRNAPLETMKEWPGFFKCCAGKKGIPGGKMLALIPLSSREGGIDNRVFWNTLMMLAPLFRFFIFLPTADWESPAVCESVFSKLPRFFRKLNQTGLASQSLWAEQVGGWVWRWEAQDGVGIPALETAFFREAQRIRAMFPKGLKKITGAGLTAVEFIRRGAKNVLMYRDDEGWLDFTKQIARTNLAGLVICGFAGLRDVGPAVISSSFAVATEKGV